MHSLRAGEKYQIVWRVCIIKTFLCFSLTETFFQQRLKSTFDMVIRMSWEFSSRTKVIFPTVIATLAYTHTHTEDNVIRKNCVREGKINFFFLFSQFFDISCHNHVIWSWQMLYSYFIFVHHHPYKVRRVVKSGKKVNSLRLFYMCGFKKERRKAQSHFHLCNQ